MRTLGPGARELHLCYGFIRVSYFMLHVGEGILVLNYALGVFLLLIVIEGYLS